MDPDIEEALKILTKRAGMMQAEKSFGHLLGKSGAQTNVPADLESKIPGTEESPLGQPTPYKSLDENAKAGVLARDVNNEQELIEDDFGDEPLGETSDEEKEEDEQPQKSFGIMSTVERSATRPIQMAPTPKRGRPRRV
jgi:hypothetical protein